jgi:hypothetical protein
MPEPKIYINVQMSETQKNRVEREEHFWTATNLVLLMIVTLGAALALLYTMANVIDGGKSETYWDNWIYPAGIQSELDYEDAE